MRIRAALGPLVDAASTGGYVRSDVDVADLLRAVGGVCMATDDGWQERTRRLIGLLLDGLKYGRPAAERAPPPSPDRSGPQHPTARARAGRQFRPA